MRISHLLLSAGVALCLSTAVQAHAFLDRADPRVGSVVSKAPTSIRLTFTQGVEAVFCRVSVTGPAGFGGAGPARAAPGDPKSLVVDLRSPTPPGSYVVRWRVLSVDTHVTEGDFSLSGPAVSEAPDLAIVAARFATFGLAILLCGAAAFDLYAPASPPRLRAAHGRRVTSALLALAALSYVVLLAREASGDPGWPAPGLVADLYAGTGFGQALAVVQLAALVLVLTPASPRFRWARLIVSGIATAALAFVGHGADDSGLKGDLRVLLLAGHLLAVSAWLGALPRLYLALAQGSAASSALLRRFAAVGAVCVATVVATGVGTLIFIVATAGGRLGSAYAAALFVKLTFVLALLCVAAVNRFWLTPQVGRDPERACRALRRTIVLEQALGVGALASVAVLGQLDPAM